jgi:hypothetical protein
MTKLENTIRGQDENARLPKTKFSDLVVLFCATYPSLLYVSRKEDEDTPLSSANF